MKRAALALALGLGLSSLTTAAAGQAAHSYQLFAVAPDKSEFGFVDVKSFNRTASAVTYWSLSVYEPPAQISNSSPVIYQMRQRIADCAGWRTKDQIVVARLQNGVERWISLIGRFRPVRPATIGDSELALVCSGKISKANLPAFSNIDAVVRFSDDAAAHLSERGPGRS